MACRRYFNREMVDYSRTGRAGLDWTSVSYKVTTVMVMESGVCHGAG